MNEKNLGEHCGIFGIFGDGRAAERSYFGLYALQHRGQESSGIAGIDTCAAEFEACTPYYYSTYEQENET